MSDIAEMNLKDLAAAIRRRKVSSVEVTKALLAAMPSLDPDNRTKVPPITGDPPNPINPPSGCRFHTRCAFAESVCSERSPSLFATGNDRHTAACHMVDPASGHSKAGQSSARELQNA